VLKQGTLADATLVAAEAKRPGKGAPSGEGKALVGYDARLAVDAPAQSLQSLLRRRHQDAATTRRKSTLK
jgi:hypothetical protein